MNVFLIIIQRFTFYDPNYKYNTTNISDFVQNELITKINKSLVNSNLFLVDFPKSNVTGINFKNK